MATPEQNPDNPDDNKKIWTRNVRLPSGKFIEVVYFDEASYLEALTQPNQGAEADEPPLTLEEINHFVDALEHGHIEPMDF